MQRIEQQYLQCLFDDMTSCAFPWGSDPAGPFESLILRENMPAGCFSSNEALAKAVYQPCFAVDNPVFTQDFIEQIFSMIDFKTLVGTIRAEYLSLEGATLVFQNASDVCDGFLICGAYAEILPDYMFEGWHNS